MFLFDISCYMRYYIPEDNDMGLDNYWMKSKEEAGVIEGEFKVCGGVFSENGNDSFRGKVYCRFIEDVTNENLYQAMIPNETVMKMADDLEATVWQDSYIENYDIIEEEFKDLVKMFRLHADAGHYLESSW